MIALLSPGCGPKYTVEESELIASAFIQESPTYRYDGIEDSLELANTETPNGSGGWQFTYRFQSSHGGYGDRTGQKLTPAVIPREARITVQEYKVTEAVIDQRWDMLAQQRLSGSEPEFTVEESELIAFAFIKESPTYRFDGIEGSLELVHTENLSGSEGWQFTYRFQSSHGGHGDRTGQTLTQAITPHEARITVQKYNVMRATMDRRWDVLTQCRIG